MNKIERIRWIDYSKVFLIYLVVLAHYGRINHNVDVLICAFHMPAFFFISGYLHKPLPFMDCLKKNAKRLLVPALLFSCLCFIPETLKLYLKYGEVDVPTHFGKMILGLFIHNREIAFLPCRVIWFLEVLFICFLILDLLERFVRTKQFIIVAAMILAVALCRQYGINDYTYTYFLQRTCASFPFVWLGYVVKKDNRINRLMFNKNASKILLITIPSYIVLALYNGRVGIASWRFGQSLLVYYFVAILGILCTILFFSLVENKREYVKGSLLNWGGQFLTLVSEGTIVILCLHSQFIWLFHHLSIPPYIGSVVIVVLCIPLIRLFNNKLKMFTGKF